MDTECTLQTSLDRDRLCLTFLGSWTIHAPQCPVPDIHALYSSSVTTLCFDTDALTQWDSRLFIELSRIIDLAASLSLTVDDQGLPPGVRKLLQLTRKNKDRNSEREKNASSGILADIGNQAIRFFRKSQEMLVFTGEILLAYSRLLLGRARFLRGDLLYFFCDCGPRALPIVTLISFLVGVILAFVGAVQLKMFGADIYIADLVGLGMTREMGAMMAAIILAGRTGAAFAAQLGTMQVNEEIDALKTMGINPMDFLVIPRMTALILMMPLLALWADFIGILGGFFIGCLTLDISPTLYYEQTVKAITLNHFSVGLIKAVVFGYLVAFCGCLKGMHCGRSASSVGRATTSAVVTAIVFIVMADASFTFLFNIIGV